MKQLLLSLLAGSCVAAQTPDAGEIMQRVSENIVRTETARAAWVYDEDVFVRLKRSNGKLAREESRQYTVAPTEKGAQRKLVKVEGRILEGRRELAYTESGHRQKDTDIDGALVDTFAREVMWRRDSIGPMAYRFPLDSKNLERYSFRFEGEERFHNYDVYRISFHDKADSWEGEVLIERNEYQPVLVTTAWTGKVPTAVMIGLGTSVQQIGAKTTYKRFDRNVWFPVQSGGEMKLRVLFFYSRTIAFSATNRDFRKADVQSSIEFGGESAR